MYDHVLVPTDGSDAASPAVGEAIDLAKAHGSTLHVLHVLEVGELPDSIEDDAQSAFERRGSRAVDGAIERAEAAGIQNVEGAVLPGRPHEMILEYAEDHDVDLVVMGTHGRTGLDRIVVGSVTEKVVRLSPVPVLTVRGAGD